MRIGFRAWIQLGLALSLFLAGPTYAQSEVEARRPTLPEIDRVLTKSDSLNTFLNSAEAQDEYFQILQLYFGADRFAREPYDKIIEQLKTVYEKFPEVAERAWDTKDLGTPFEVKTFIKSSGLELKHQAFDKWLEQWEQRLTHEYPVRDLRDLQEMAESLSREIAAHYQTTAQMKRADRIRASGDFLPRLQNRPEFKEVANYCLSKILSEEGVHDRMRSGDADIVLNEIAILRKGGQYAIGGKSLSKELQSLIGRQIEEIPTPKLEVVNGKGLETDLFAVKTRVTNRSRVVPVGQGSANVFKFRPVPRRMHGLFKGIVLKECVAGACDSLNSMTPERTFTVLLEGTNFYHIEIDTPVGPSYQGFEQLVPGQVAGTKLASVDFGSPLFGQKTINLDGEMGIFYDLWLPIAIQHLPTGCEGIVVSQSNASNNAGALDPIRKRPSYLLGEFASREDRFVLTDDLAKILSSLGIRSGYAQNYGGRMIFDAVVPKAGWLTILNPNASLPNKIDFDYAANLLVKFNQTFKDEAIFDLLFPKIQPLSVAQRERLFELAKGRQFSERSITKLYQSHLVDKLTPQEAPMLHALSITGHNIVLEKGSASEGSIIILLERLNSEDVSEASVKDRISAIPHAPTTLHEALKNRRVALAAARVLQLVGRQDQSSDEVVISALSVDLDDELIHNHENILSHYLEATKDPSPVLLEAVKEKGLRIDRRNIFQASRDMIARSGRPSADLQAHLLNLIEEAKSLWSQIQLAKIFFSQTDVPPQAQIAFLAAVGAEDWEQENILNKLGSLPTLSPKTLEWLAGRAGELDNDRRWRYVKYIREARNIKVEDLREAFQPLLKSDSENTKVFAARILASHGLATPEVESVILDLCLNDNTIERTVATMDERFQLSPEAIQQVIERMVLSEKNGSLVAEFRDLLALQKNISPASLSRLRELLSHNQLRLQLAAAWILIKSGARNPVLLEILIRPLGDFDWRQDNTISRLRSALLLLPISDQAYLELAFKKHKYPGSYEKIADLIPETQLQTDGFSERDLELFWSYDAKTKTPLNADQTAAFVRLLVNRKIPNKFDIYTSLKSNTSFSLQSRLNAGLESSSDLGRFYSALLLSNLYGQWDPQIEAALIRWFGFKDVPLGKVWSPASVRTVRDHLSDWNTLDSASREHLIDILSNSPLDQETVRALLKSARSEDLVLSRSAKTILLKNESVASNRKVRELLDEGPPFSEGPGQTDYWIERLINGEAKKLSEIPGKLSKVTLSEVQILKLTLLLTSAEPSRRVASAAILAETGLWSGSIESAFVDALLDVDRVCRWNAHYFSKKLEPHELSTIATHRFLTALNDEQILWASISRLSEFKLGHEGMQELHNLKSDPKLRLYASIILLNKGEMDYSHRAVIMVDGPGRLNSEWMIDKLKGFDPEPADIQLLIKETTDPDHEKAKAAHYVLFGFTNPGHHLLEAYTKLLESDSESLRVSAALNLPLENPSPLQQRILAGAMVNNGQLNWHSEFFFTKLEQNIHLAEEAQVVLAQNISATRPENTTYAVRLLINQLTLAPKALDILLEAKQNPFAREIIASKKNIMGDGMCEGFLLDDQPRKK